MGLLSELLPLSLSLAGRGGLIFGGVNAIWLILKEGDKDGAGGGETEEWRGEPNGG